MTSQEDTSYLYFYKTIGIYGPFSQWYYCDVILEPDHFSYLPEVDIAAIKKIASPIKFNTAEQYMMFSKALLFSDYGTAAQIMEATDPSSQKKLGRLVENFDDDVWKKWRSQIVEEANVAKFGQNEKEREVLLSTGERQLVEASPRDKIWGIGFGAENAPKNMQRWGLNLLGKALVVARTRLREQK